MKNRATARFLARYSTNRWHTPISVSVSNAFKKGVCGMGNQGEHSNRRRSIVALVLGVISLVASLFIPYGGLLGIVGIVMARKVRQGAQRKIALIGMISSALAIIWMFFAFISPTFPHMFPFGAITHGSSSTQSLTNNP